MTDVSRIVLGTAQLSSNYGITNLRGSDIDDQEPLKLLKSALSSGLQNFDTAPAYPKSERLLGQVLEGRERIFTKVSWSDHQDVEATKDWCRKSLLQSSRNLKRETIYGVFTHSSALPRIRAFEEVIETLEGLKAEGLVKRIGCSIYDREELEAIGDVFVPDILQVPANPFDRRFLEDNIVTRMRERGTKVFARSIFLQGLLLAEGDRALPQRFHRWKEIFKAWFDFCDRVKKSPLEICIDWALSETSIDYFVLGIYSETQLSQILHAFENASGDFVVPSRFSMLDKNLIDPRTW